MHLRSHGIIDGGSYGDPVFHRGRGGSLRLESCGFLAFSAHHVIGRVPAGQRGRVRLELGTSRVVGKHGERGKTKVSAQRTRLGTQ